VGVHVITVLIQTGIDEWRRPHFHHCSPSSLLCAQLKIYTQTPSCTYSEQEWIQIFQLLHVVHLHLKYKKNIHV
jgi:hypothetical protein